MRVKKLTISVVIQEDGDDVRYCIQADEDVKSGYLNIPAAKAEALTAAMGFIRAVAADRLATELMEALSKDLDA